MFTSRGCFAACYHEGRVWALGGINYSERIMSKCEMFDPRDNLWHQIAPMKRERKNAGAVGLNSDTIYVFGGSNAQVLDSIEKYSISQDQWTELPIKLPDPASFLSPFKVTNRHILIFGGQVKAKTADKKTFKSDQVLIFDSLGPDIKI